MTDIIVVVLILVTVLLSQKNYMMISSFYKTG
jgi:hypothetical protein